MKRTVALIGLAGLFALPAYFGANLWNNQELLRKTRELGVQTDGVVTKLKFSHRINWGDDVVHRLRLLRRRIEAPR